jgi:aldehyde dehydrogenase (NAD+)
VCVIGAWNYPFQLTVVGVIGALAAGNTVLIKPSEVSPNCAAVIEEAMSKYFDSDVVGIVQGAAEETTAVLKERFDHILYTGNAAVGRIVMTAAAKHLTPVTLELGGKSPVYVHSDADLNVAARRIVWGRTVNAGQTCIAPDYILAHDSIKAGLIAALKKAITDFYGANPQTSPDYGRIVNDRHFARVSGLIKSATVVAGGETDAATRYIAPTILDDVSPDCAAMQEEIFGPLFPILPVAGPEAGIDFINKGEKPLALYVFTRTAAVKTAFREQTSSGAILINDTLMHAAFESLPFGGVGNSGMGAYHGQLTFDRFSHHKAVLEKDAGMEVFNSLRYAPYGERKQAILGALAGRVGPSWRWFFDLSATLVSVGASFLGFGRFAPAKKQKAE